jgi:hypothetical protein
MRTSDETLEIAYIKKTSDGCWMIRARRVHSDCDQLETELMAEFGSKVAVFCAFGTCPPVVDVRTSPECTEEEAEAMCEQIRAFGQVGDVTLRRVQPSTSYQWVWTYQWVGLTRDMYDAIGWEEPLLTKLRLRNDTGEAVTKVSVPRRGDLLRIRGTGVFDIRSAWSSVPKVDMAPGETLELESIYLPTSMRRSELPRGFMNDLQ